MGGVNYSRELYYTGYTVTVQFVCIQSRNSLGQVANAGLVGGAVTKRTRGRDGASRFEIHSIKPSFDWGSINSGRAPLGIDIMSNVEHFAQYAQRSRRCQKATLSFFFSFFGTHASCFL